MAEFENGYCTGCGFPAGKRLFAGLHRPYCWRKITMMLNVDPTPRVIAVCLKESSNHWRLFSGLLRRPKHMYYHEDQDWVLEDSE